MMLLLVVVARTDAGAADMYKWVDKNGVVHFSDRAPAPNDDLYDLEAIPLAPRSPRVSEEKMPPAAQPAAKTSPASVTFKKTRAPQTQTVELYVTSWCPYCKKARNFFRSRGIPFREYDIEKDRKAARRKKRMDPQGGVPFAVIYGQKVSGYSKELYKDALRKSKARSE